MKEDVIVLRSVFGKVNQSYHISPCRDPKTGLYPECVKRVDKFGDMVLSESDKESGKVFIPEDEAIVVTDGTVFDLNDPLQAARWAAIKNCILISPGRDARDKNGDLITGTATIESLGGKQYFSNYYTNAILTDDTHNLLIPVSSLNIPFTPSVIKGYLRTGYEGHYIYDGFSITSGGTGWGINSFYDDEDRQYSSFHLSNISSSTRIYVYRIRYADDSTIQAKKRINEIFVEAYS